ncbi:DUF2147 domain-containing protein [Kordiimonas gwangyangensis]|uniref:DUF2147 domain-containing protein n=1 Tax=Kordiimonas gwangyangensis TaxID=288022 RepID=UPI00138AF2F4|nr:DUF2147 domain-containing protein [Kordiimonas gwangyangensis]
MSVSARLSNLNSSFKTLSLGVVATALMATAAYAGPSGDASASGPTGFWQSSGGGRMIEVAPCSAKTSKLCGTIVWAEDAAEVDEVILKRFRAVGEIWAGGQIYEPGKRRGEDGRLSMTEDGSLEVSECKRGLCENTTWTRVDEATVASRVAKLMAEN